MSIQFEGSSYDLTDFPHPGGKIIRAAFNTDATALIHSYHPNVERVRRAIESYKQPKDGTKTTINKAEHLYKGPLYADLKKRVHAFLQKNQETTGADLALRFKMVVLLVWYFLSFVWLTLARTRSDTLLAASSLGAAAAMVGMNVMHDASHMAVETSPGSSSKWNYLWQLSGDILGLSTIGWRYQHVIQHHVHTDNKDDPDAAFIYPLLRSSDDQPHLFLHYFQILLLPVPMLSLVPMFQVFDTVHVLTGVYTFEGLRKPLGTHHTKAEWVQFAFARFCHLGLWAMLWHKGGFEVWAAFGMCGSFLLSQIDVPGHYTTNPPLPDKLPPSIVQGDVIDNWLLEQLHHTNTFAPSLNGVFGGLNMQVEHHLFPRISHRHYPALRLIVKEFCKEHGLPYNDYSLYGVIWATLVRFAQLSLPPTKTKVI